MQLSELLSPDCTKCAVEGASKKRLLETISQIVAPKLSGITRQHENHLQTLASVARRMNDKDCTRALRQADSDKDLYQLFIGEGEQSPCN